MVIRGARRREPIAQASKPDLIYSTAFPEGDVRGFALASNNRAIAAAAKTRTEHRRSDGIGIGVPRQSRSRQFFWAAAQRGRCF